MFLLRRAQYSAMLERDFCGSARCNGRFMCEEDYKHECHVSLHAQYLLMLEGHISCQVQHGARNALFFTNKMRLHSSANGQVANVMLG